MRRLILPFAVLIAGCESERQVITIADSLDVPAGRTIVLPASTPLRTPNLSRSGEVCLTLLPPLSRGTSGFAIMTPDGRGHVPDVSVLRGDGVARALTSPSYLGEMFCLGFNGPGEPGPPYTAVRIQSDVPLRLGAVTWLSADK